MLYIYILYNTHSGKLEQVIDLYILLVIVTLQYKYKIIYMSFDSLANDIE